MEGRRRVCACPGVPGIRRQPPPRGASRDDSDGPADSVGWSVSALESVVNGAEGRNEPKERCLVRLTGPATGRRLLLPAAQAEEPIVRMCFPCQAADLAGADLPSRRSHCVEPVGDAARPGGSPS